MNPDPTITDDEHADQLILQHDQPRKGWQRRAVGTSREAALDQIPRVGMLQAQFPIEPLRVLQHHIHRTHQNQSVWVREAVVQRFLREHGDPAIADQLLDMRVDRRRRDVPRDQYGQPRNRQGRQ